MKKTIKINFRNFWPGFNPEDNFFTNLLRKKYKIEISSDPEYVFYSVYSEGGIKNAGKIGEKIKKISPLAYNGLRQVFGIVHDLIFNKKIEAPKGQFVKIFYGSEHVKPNMNECDWAFGSQLEEEIKHPRYVRIPIYNVCDYQLGDKTKPKLIKKVDFNKIKKEKNRFCNFIYSHDVPERNEFFKILNEYKKIDSPGRCMNNMPPIKAKDPRSSRLSNNWVLNKLEFIKKYKFTIAFENFSSSGWVTEKLTHPMLVNSIPIYVGHKDVAKEFNTKSFININDFKNMKEFIEHIKKVDQNDELYKKYLKEPWYKDSNQYKNVDFGNKLLLKKMSKIFG